MEYKTNVVLNDVEGRTVTGIAAVMGNVDDAGDRLWRGAFTATLRDPLRQVCFLWQHDLSQPPIAVIRDLREIGREELPADIVADYPDATGGLLVTRTYLHTAQADGILEGIKARAICGMSFGFDALKYDYQRIGTERKQVRNLRTVRLWELSDTAIPANPATRAIKTVSRPVQHVTLLRLAIAQRESALLLESLADKE